MNLESPKTTVQKSQEELYAYLTDIANFKQILPDDVEEFHATDDSFKFALKGMPAIRLAFEEKQEFHLIKLKATSDMFPVYLTCTINAVDENQCEAQLYFDGEINAMMAMMIKKPLQNLLITLSEKMHVL